MPPLRRHQLAWLSESGWRGVLARDWPDAVRPMLLHWREHRLPLVVTRQPEPRLDDDAPVHLGLPFPPQWGLQPVKVAVRPRGLLWFSEFPALGEAVDGLPRGARPALLQLDQSLRTIDVRARVYGSAGWQCITGLAYLHDRSDLDIWLAVDDPGQADRVALLLQGCQCLIRIDGELMFADGRAVAWREWQAARSGQQARMLVKRLDGLALETVQRTEDALWARAA